MTKDLVEGMIEWLKSELQPALHNDVEQLAGLAYLRGKSESTSIDKVVETNRELLLQRSNVGITKYGVTLEKSNLSEEAILQHALEEALDLANYLQTRLMIIRKKNGNQS